MKKETKTNVMRLLDQSGIKYETLYYDLGDEKFSGEAVSDYLGLEYDTCFKTLALKHEHDLFITVIPVNKNLNLKKPIYRKLASYGHMGREDLGILWERPDKVGTLKQVLGEF